MAEAGARTPCPLPAEGRPAAPRTAQTERPLQRPARGRRGREPGRGGSPPLPPHPRRADPLAAARSAPDARGRPATPAARVYPGGARQRPRMARRRLTGRGGGPPSPPPPSSPPQLGSHGSDPPPPRSREGAPPPPEGTATRGGGMQLDLHTVRPSTPSRLLPRGSRPTGESTPARRSNARTKPGGGARRRTRTVWRPRPP